jgi:Uma2 family endonuclease
MNTALAEQLVFIPIETYLVEELQHTVRHEYLNGQVYAMVGVSVRHNLINGNLYMALRHHLKGTPCRVLIAEVKVRIKTQQQERFYYPDVMVTCEPLRDPYYQTQPKLVIEVLSEATKRLDRTEKFEGYRLLPSLEEYVLVAQEPRWVEIYRRRTNWQREIYQANTSLLLETVALSLPLSAIYEGVEET